MSKLTPVVAFAVVAGLLSGCSPSPEPEPESQTPRSSEAAEPTSTPSATTTTEAPEETQTPAPAETTAAEPAPTTEPEAEPSPEEIPTLEPLPAGPDDPFVPPPHGEPAPGPMTNHTVTPQGEWGAVHISVAPGSVLTVTGSGYNPGQRIFVSFGPSRSDYSIIGEQYAYADASGNFSFPITLSPAIEPGSYGILTAVPDAQDVDPTRRWATIDVSAT